VNVQEFGKLAGVTVRALHHYDRLGLLRPRRTGAGYRVYSTRDLERLEQIVALKFLGIPLKQIKDMLDLSGLDLPDALRMQRTVLEQKRRLLDRAILAIREAEQSIAPGKRADSALLTKIIEVIEMENDSSWTEKYYSPEARAKIDERRKEWAPELQAQALAVRWKTLVAGFTGGDSQIGAGLNKLYAERANWPSQTKELVSPLGNPKVWEYMGRAMKCGLQ
jgi:DNA-binding transcriptional MerR regulator